MTIFKIIILFSALRPVLYMQSVFYSRLSDLLAFILALSVILVHQKVHKRIKLLTVALLCYFVIILLSLCHSILSGNNIIFRDLLEMIRPLFWIIYLWMGSFSILYYRDEMNSEIANLFIFLGLVNSALCILMFAAPDRFVFLYELYSVPNLYYSHRPGGIAYTHTEYVAINLLSIFYILLDNRFTKFKSGMLIVFISLASLLSLSKGGVLLLLTFFALLFIFEFGRRYFIYSLVSIILLSSLIFVMWNYVEAILMTNVPYLYWGFINLFSYFQSGATQDGSIGPRAAQWLIAVSGLGDGFWELLIGHSPLRDYKEISYIESTFPNVMFRFGLLGLIFYYGFFILSIRYIAPNRRKPYMALVISLICADMTANFTESIKFMCLMGFLIGFEVSRPSVKYNKSNGIGC